MSIAAVALKMKENNWAIPESDLPYKLQCKINKIKDELNRLNKDYWKQKALKLAVLDNNYRADKSLENKIALQEFAISIFTDELRVQGYLKILEKPFEYKEIMTHTLKTIEEIKAENKNLVNELYEKGEQLKLD